MVELRSIADEIAERGNVHACRVERLLAVTADAGLARRFNLPVGAKLFHSIVVHSESDVPVQLEERWVNPAVAPEYLDQDFTRQTPGEYLIRLESSPQVEHVIEAVSPTPEIARLLDIPVTEPCLRVTRRTWVQGRVVTVAMLVHPGSRYRLGARFQLPPP